MTMTAWSIVLTTALAWLPSSLSWHAFDNTHYHCWDHTASATNTVPRDCQGFDLRYIQRPEETVKAEEAFHLTYELVVNDTFYPWAYTNGYFDGISGTITDAASAKTWCETTSCPAAEDAKITNCCIWHVNVHSCPLSETVGGLCGPWLKPAGTGTYTHSDVLVGPISTGNWTSHVTGLYQLGVTSLIAHFKIAGMQVALETKVNVQPRAVCGDGVCERPEGEDCGTCPADCGACPLETWQLAAIIAGGGLVLCAIVGVVLYIQYQKRRLFWDESWMIPFEAINHDEQPRGKFGSLAGSGVDMLSIASNGTSCHGSATSMARKQVFAKTCMYGSRSCAIKYIQKKEFSITKGIRWEVKETRECDHANLCRFVGACVDVPNVCILTEYCPKGSLSDVLLNENVPLNWAFRFSFAADIARGMNYLHGRSIYHGRLKSSNCVVDDRWIVKISDYGLSMLRLPEELGDDKSDIFETSYQEKRAQVYSAPELIDLDVRPATEAGDVYAYGIILLEIAVRNDPYGEEDVDRIPRGWKPELPDLSARAVADNDDPCPCSVAYTDLIQECWNGVPDMRPRFSRIQRIIRRINPSKLSPVDLMMNMMEKYSKHLELVVSERTQDLVAEKAKTDRLLHSMLPRLVADELRLGRPINAEVYDACTIYFSDIVGFTSISGASTPVQVVGLLNKLYTTFDEIIGKYDVYKVETIGDAYMVVSGIPEVTQYHGREVANMAIDLVQASRVFIIPHMPAEALNIRVGLHSGSACAGVVGLKMPRYCLFGDTVNTASRMESNGEANKIHMSNCTYEELVNVGGYRIEQRGIIPVKGKGEMLTWWLHGRDNEAGDNKHTANRDNPDTRTSNGTIRSRTTIDTVKKTVTLAVHVNDEISPAEDKGTRHHATTDPRNKERNMYNGRMLTPIGSPSPDQGDVVCLINNNGTGERMHNM